MTRLWAILALVGFFGACGGTPPPPTRGVLEKDIHSWKFRRYQQLLDVEVWVPKNKAVAYTASYAYGEALKRGRLDDRDVVNAIVIRYKRHRGVLRGLVKFARRLAQESGYVVDESKVGGVRVFLVTGHGEKWALWAANKHVVKVGGRGIDAVPKSVVESYGDRYPSTMRTGLLEGPLPPGIERKDGSDEDEKYDPDSPTPDWDKYETGSKKKKK